MRGRNPEGRKGGRALPQCLEFCSFRKSETAMSMLQNLNQQLWGATPLPGKYCSTLLTWQSTTMCSTEAKYVISELTSSRRFVRYTFLWYCVWVECAAVARNSLVCDAGNTSQNSQMKVGEFFFFKRNLKKNLVHQTEVNCYPYVVGPRNVDDLDQTNPIILSHSISHEGHPLREALSRVLHGHSWILGWLVL